jgi:hypothetical protein
MRDGKSEIEIAAEWAQRIITAGSKSLRQHYIKYVQEELIPNVGDNPFTEGFLKTIIRPYLNQK